MNVKKFLPLIIAIVLGGIAAKMAMNLATQKPTTVVVGSAKSMQVAVAKHNIAAGDLITDADVAMGDVSGDALPETVFKDPSDLVGRVAAVPIVQGQAIMSTLLAAKGVGPGLQATIPQGMRAFTMEINEYSGVAGYLSPGAHVDVVQTMRDDKTSIQISRTIIQNVRVIAIGTKDTTDNASNNGRSATLLLTPQQSVVMELASVIGHPRLVLRSGSDLASASTESVSMTDLRGRDPAENNAGNTVRDVVADVSASTRPVETEYWTVRVIRGDQESDVKFDMHQNSASDVTASNGDDVQ